MAEALAGGPDFLRLMLIVTLERRHADPRALEIIRSHRTRSIASVARVLTALAPEGIELDAQMARDAASLMIACFDGAFTAVQIDADQVDLRRMLGLLHSALVAVLSPAATKSD
jgi:hypothetical protein